MAVSIHPLETAHAESVFCTNCRFYTRAVEFLKHYEDLSKIRPCQAGTTTPTTPCTTLCSTSILERVLLSTARCANKTILTAISCYHFLITRFTMHEYGELYDGQACAHALSIRIDGMYGRLVMVDVAYTCEGVHK